MRRTVSWTLLTGGMLLVAGCGGGDDTAGNADMTMNTSGEMMLGNDASAVEVVANQGSAVMPLPANGAAPANGSRSQVAPASAPTAASGSTRTPAPAPAPTPPAGDRSTPPGGDRGGNSSDSNISSI